MLLLFALWAHMSRGCHFSGYSYHNALVYGYCEDGIFVQHVCMSVCIAYMMSHLSSVSHVRVRACVARA